MPDPRPLRELPRSFVRTFGCPACGAAPGEPCLGARQKERISNHRERVVVADRDPRAVEYRNR